MIEIPYPPVEFCASMHEGQLEVLRDFDKKSWRFALVNWHRRARKSTLSIILLIREALIHPKSRYIYIAPTYVAAKNIIWRDPQMLKRWLPMDAVLRMNDSELFVEFKNGSILSIHGSDNPDSLRGLNCHGVVLDEASQCQREVWEQIIRPIIAQDKKRWAMFIFTPNGKNWIHEYWLRAKLWPEWKTYLLTAEESGLIPEDELVKLQKESPAKIYAQEFGCSFTDSASSVFKNIEECVSGSLQGASFGYTYVTGVDLAKSEDFTVLTTICRETRQVVDFQRFNQTEWALQKELIIQTVRKYNSLCVVDSTGVGDPIAEDLTRAGISVLPVKISAQSKKELIERLIVAIEQRLITFPDIQELIDELGSFAYDISDFGNIRYRAPEGMHDDCVISLALAVKGMKSFIYPKVKREYRPRVSIPQINKEPLNAGFSYATK